jgi:aminoglycoside phosphotransferase (APT) family kinase protein
MGKGAGVNQPRWVRRTSSDCPTQSPIYIERDVYTRFQTAMDELLSYCATQKHLIHGDFGFHKTISDSQAIMGVLGWEDSQLGDFLYDVVTLDSFDKDTSYGDLWREYTGARGTKSTAL